MFRTANLFSSSSASPAGRGASPRRSPVPHSRSPKPRSRSPAPDSRSPKPRSRSPAPHSRSATPRSRSPTPPSLDRSPKKQTNGKGSSPSRSVSPSPQRASSRSPHSDGKVRLRFYCWLCCVAPLHIYACLTLESKTQLSGVKLAVMP